MHIGCDLMIELEELLNPIAEESPCGPDVSYDPKFLALDALIVGKPETQFSAAEEPDWKAVHDICIELLRRSKNLRVAVTLCIALVKLEGAAGLRAGLTLLKGLLERYWMDLYPRLDLEDNNDPLERVNVISPLSAPLGTFGDPIQFLQRLRRIPLTNSARMGQFSLADISDDKILPGEEKSSVSPAQIEAAFRDTRSDELVATAQAISESILLLRAIDRFLIDTIGVARAPDMGPLMAVLLEIDKCLSPYVPKILSQVSGEGGPKDSPASGEEGSDGGVIRSRQDVTRALERICEYYARTEPSSPLPFLLRRAQRLVDMNFIQIVDELTPEARATLDTIIGLKPDTSGQ
jgi:type VI secretion system protein ImpA